MTDAERYAISVKKVIVEGEEYWRATVRELPDLAEFAGSREEAIDLAIDSIESLKSAASEEGRAFPEPIVDEEEYSGRVTLRLPKSVHRAVALKAIGEDVSLNSYICTVLTADVSMVMSSAPEGHGYEITHRPWSPYMWLQKQVVGAWLPASGTQISGTDPFIYGIPVSHISPSGVSVYLTDPTGPDLLNRPLNMPNHAPAHLRRPARSKVGSSNDY